MITPAYAHVLLSQWGAWSNTGGIIPRRMQALSARWQSEIPTEWPEEPECDYLVTTDDDTLGLVDSVVASLRQREVRHYVVLVDVYRNRHTYARQVEDDALRCFVGAWNARQAGRMLGVDMAGVKD